MADWYDRKQGEEGDLWHRALIDPVLLRLIGECGKMSVLDLGCGNGYIARKLARDGAKVTAVDASAKMLDRARSHDPSNSLGISYLCLDAANLTGLEDATFDVACANMSMMDFENAESAIRETSRVLKKGGRLVASLSHPCFDVGSRSDWVIEKNLVSGRTYYRRVKGYRSVFSEAVPWRLGGGAAAHTMAFHRPLNWYARAMRASGFAITALEEPEPTAEFMEKEDDAQGFLEVPLHLVIEAVKVRGGRVP